MGLELIKFINSESNIWAVKSKNGSNNNQHLKMTDKEVSDLNDFSGIELLAATACCSYVYDIYDHMETFAMEDPTTPRIDRSSPADKYDLVKHLRGMSKVVEVTSDGTNDAPTLHELDIGFAMGIAGTKVAKEQADVIVMDDDFAIIGLLPLRLCNCFG